MSSRLHLNRLSRPDLSLADLSANWRRRVRVPHLAAPRIDWSVIGSRLRLGLSRVKVEVPTIKMPPIRSRRGWCGCFQVSYKHILLLPVYPPMVIYTHKYACTLYTVSFAKSQQMTPTIRLRAITLLHLQRVVYTDRLPFKDIFLFLFILKIKKRAF